MRRAARVDNTAKALTAAAKQLGARILVINGTIDCVLETPRGHYLLVDWKSPGATLTETQAKLVAGGWKINFISTVEQLQRLLRES
jgi:ATP-dependent exoDNAse (exonuclease V) beta subunit